MISFADGCDTNVKFPCQCADTKLKVTGNAYVANVTHLFCCKFCMRVVSTVFSSRFAGVLAVYGYRRGKVQAI